jgi:hypothetical protein
MPDLSSSALRYEQMVSGNAPKAASKAVDLSGAADAAAAAAEGLKSKFSGLAGGLSGGLSGLKSSVGGGLSGLKSSVGGAVGGLTSGVDGAVGGLKGGVDGAVGGLADTVGGLAGSVGGVADTLKGTVGGAVGGLAGSAAAGAGTALSAAKSQLDTVTAGLGGATSAATSALGQATGAATSATRAATDALNSTLGETTGALQAAAAAAAAQAAALSAQVAGSVDAATAQALDALPPPARDALVAVGGAAAVGAAAAADAAAAHPQAAAVTVAAVGVPTAIAWYRGRYAGYAGELSPASVQQLLAEGDALLVDVRPEGQREADGTPELKLGARFKVVAFPLEEATAVVAPRVARQAGNAAELKLLVNAALISGLRQVRGPMTKVVIMDRDGGDAARALARALASVNQPQAFVMTGGFRGWRDAAGLPVSEAAGYTADAGALLADNVEVVVKELSRPANAVVAGAGALLALAAAVNYHTTLEFVGVLGTLLLGVNKALSYSTPQEALDDLSAAAGKLQGLAGAAGQAAGAATKAAGAATKALPKSAPRLPQVSLPKAPTAPAPAGKDSGIKEGGISDVGA